MKFSIGAEDALFKRLFIYNYHSGIKLEDRLSDEVYFQLDEGESYSLIPDQLRSDLYNRLHNILFVQCAVYISRLK